MTGLALAVIGGLGLHAAQADQIIPPATPLDPNGPASFVFRLDRAVTATGVLAFEWTDASGRLVDRRDIPFNLADGTDIALTIDLRRSVVMGNTLTAQWAPRHPVQASFVAPQRDPWLDWQTILYQPRDPPQLAALRRVGLTGGMVFANRGDPDHIDTATIDRLVGQNLHWYVENIATDFYAEYHRWRPDRTETADFIEVKQAHRQAPNATDAFIRAPSLSDPVWLARIHDRLDRTVKAFTPYQPIYYSLADEPGIADLAAAWDFDFSPPSLAGFRDWLHGEYPSLDALNLEWGSHFQQWADVMPATTDQAMARTDDNFAAWADFKGWMDVAFATAVRAGTNAVHAADPQARAAIEGTQVPGWGGYDYSRLATAVDVMELYDFGQNVDIVRSLNPALLMISTISGHDDATLHGLWRSLLMGMRGVILWDDKDDLARPDGSLDEAGRGIAPTLERLRDGLGALLINAHREPAAIAVLYSPPSFRTEWLLDQKPGGPEWVVRDAEAEYQDTPLRAAIRGFTHLLAHLGLQGDFVSPQGLADGVLDRGGYRALVLPHVTAMSPAEVAAVRHFAGAGGLVIADIMPGAFDAHSRRRPAFPLAELFSAPAPGIMVSLGQGPLADAMDGRDAGALSRLAAVLAKPRIIPDLHLVGTDGQPVNDVSIYRYRVGGAWLYALQRDFPLQPGTSATEGVTVKLPQPRMIQLVQGPSSPGRLTRLTVSLDPVMPSLLAVADDALPAPVLSAPATAQLGQNALFGLDLPGPEGGPVHIEVRNPAGEVDLRYSANALVSKGGVVWRLPLAVNDLPGAWTLSATNPLSGQSATAGIDVIP